MKMPSLIYGTAWKKEATANLVFQAIQAGFRGIDTAAQPKHYQEPGVGEALKRLESHGIQRREIFIQTKFTPLSGQDPARIPYNPRSPHATQVEESFVSSQKNLGVESVDSLVLHSPLSDWDSMMNVWTAMEKIQKQGGTEILGISNCYDLDILKQLCQDSQIPPRVVQNRFYSESDYDLELRAWCKEEGILYQGFWTLTANPHILAHPHLVQMATEHGRTTEQIFYRFLTQLGIVPLIGTCSEKHMKEDLGIFAFKLGDKQVQELQLLLS